MRCIFVREGKCCFRGKDEKRHFVKFFAKNENDFCKKFCKKSKKSRVQASLLFFKYKENIGQLFPEKRGKKRTPQKRKISKKARREIEQTNNGASLVRFINELKRRTFAH